MKPKAQYIFAFTIIISLLLASCSPPPTATPNVTTATSSATATITPFPTETSIPTATQIVLNVSPEIQRALVDSKALNPDGSIVNKLAHSELTQTVSIAPESIIVLPSNNTAVNVLIAGKGKDNQRYVWNAEIGTWTPERQFSMEYETAQIIKVDEVHDGSLRLSALLYYAEHPELIPPVGIAIDPHYKINVSRSDFSIGRYRISQGAWPDYTDPTKETILHEDDIATKRSWGWLGLIRILLKDGSEIVSMSDMLRNSVPENPWNVLPRNTGFDSEFFLDTSNFNKIGSDGLTTWQRVMQKDDVQLETKYPYPAGWWENDSAFTRNFGGFIRMPHVTGLMQKDKSLLKMFSAQVQRDIQKAYETFMANPNARTSPENSFSLSVDVLPDDMSLLILYPKFSDPTSP